MTNIKNIVEATKMFPEIKKKKKHLKKMIY